MLIGAIAQKHYLLGWVNPKDELLKYFTINEEGNFRMCPEIDFEEYINRFRGDLMSVDDFVDQFADPLAGEINSDDVGEYYKELLLATMQSYFSALEDEINKIEIGN